MSLRKLTLSGKGNKWNSHYYAAQKFMPEWQTKYPWVEKAKDGSVYRANLDNFLFIVAVSSCYSRV